MKLSWRLYEDGAALYAGGIYVGRVVHYDEWYIAWLMTSEVANIVGYYMAGDDARTALVSAATRELER